MNFNQEHITNADSLPFSLRTALAEVEETTQLLHLEVEQTIDSLPQPINLQQQLPSQLVLQNLLYQLFECISQVLKVDTVAVLLWAEADQQQLTVRAARGLEEEVYAKTQIPVGRGFAGSIAAQRQLTIVDDLSTVEVYSPILRNKRLKSMLGIPLLANGQVLGVFHVGTFRLRRFSEEDISLLNAVAQRLGAIIDQLAIVDHDDRVSAQVNQTVVSSWLQKFIHKVVTLIAAYTDNLRLVYLFLCCPELLSVG